MFSSPKSVQDTNKNPVKISGKKNLIGEGPMEQFSQMGILSYKTKNAVHHPVLPTVHHERNSR